MRKIEYTSRKGGNATYWDITPTELLYIKSQLQMLMYEIAERNISTDPLDQNLVALWTAAHSGLGYSPKHKTENNIASVVGGILKNLNTGTRDLTDKNCDKLEQVFFLITEGVNQGLFPKMNIDTIQFVKKTKSTNELNPNLFTQ
jgi:hypothetical protein